ncbi:class I SAM-dependent methyltransferase [Moorena producens]|uniref:class I SAM-dependent methyltransferase n=1 Tax=Moorena producens TaxID=1155739 RepID=UPI003C757DDD
MLAELMSGITELKNKIYLYPYKKLSRNKIKQYLKENIGKVRVNIGAGSNLLPGWLNAELWPLEGTVHIDITEKLPFESGTVKYISCEHLIEHVSYHEALRFFHECWRVLEDGGVFRCSTPDLEKLIYLYRGDDEVLTKDILLPHHRKHHNANAYNMCQWLNDHVRLWGHQFIYDQQTLINSLQEAGFTKVIKCKYGESMHKDLQNLEKHDEGEVWMKEGYVMIFEAAKL